MDTPPTPTTPEPAAPKGAGIAKKINTVIAVIGILVFAMIFFGQKLMMGTKYKVSDKETIGYSEKATEDDAKKLADILKAEGIFSGTMKVDVLLKRDDKEGLVISFVPSGSAKDEKVISLFTAIGEDIAAKGFGKPLTVRLIDDHFNMLNDIVIK